MDLFVLLFQEIETSQTPTSDRIGSQLSEVSKTAEASQVPIVRKEPARQRKQQKQVYFLQPKIT